jgi:hypothetical protein
MNAPGRRSGLWLALAIQLVLSLGYLIITPAFEAPDEGDHLRYAFHISHTGELPLIRGTWKELGRPQEDEATQAYHPPGYYGLLALTMRAAGHRDTVPVLRMNPGFADWENEDPGLNLHYVHGADERSPVSSEMRLLWLLRGWSVLFGLIAVFATYRLGRLAFPGNPIVADLAAVLLACVPKWSYMHGVINNGIPASSLSTVVVLLLAMALVRRQLTPGMGVCIGVIAGMAIMSKLTALFLLPVMFTIYVVGCCRWPNTRRQTVVSAFLALAGLGLVTAGFFLRNLDLYGSLMALDVHQLSFHERIRVPPEFAWEWITQYFYPNVFTSFVGHFGWWILPPLQWLVWLGSALTVVSLLGWGLRLRVGRREGGEGSDSNTPVIVLLLGVSLIVFSVTLRYNFMMRGPHARYLFPALGPMMVLFAAGLVTVGSRLGPRMARCWRLAFWVPVAIGVYVLFFQFAPAFQPELAPANRWHASLVSHLAREEQVNPGSADVELSLLSPADGAVEVQPPLFCWTAAEDDPEARYTVHVFSADGRVLIATHAFFSIEISETCWQMPRRGWDLLPFDEEVFWKVRRVPDRAVGEAAAEVPRSEVFRVTKQSRK